MNDWRNDVLRSLPDKKVAFRVVTFESALDLIEVAAYNRRMRVEDFAGRAALAVAAHDAGMSWGEVTRKEPPIYDMRRHSMPAKRAYGRGHGHWSIPEMK